MVNGVGLKSFEDSRTWQASAELAVKVYLVIKKLPKTENFAMSSQLRRAVVSVSTNIAEGFGRTGPREKLQFYNIAYGSLLEVRSLLLIAEKLSYLKPDDIGVLMNDITSVQKQLNALKRSQSPPNP